MEIRSEIKRINVRIDSLERRIEMIESDIKDIKNLLYKVIDISQSQKEAQK